MPDDIRAQEPSNDAPRDPLDDLIAPILGRDVTPGPRNVPTLLESSKQSRCNPLDDLVTDAELRAEASKAAARSLASNQGRRNPLDDLLSDAVPIAEPRQMPPRPRGAKHAERGSVRLGFLVGTLAVVTGLNIAKWPEAREALKQHRSLPANERQIASVPAKIPPAHVDATTPIAIGGNFSRFFENDGPKPTGSVPPAVQRQDDGGKERLEAIAPLRVDDAPPRTPEELFARVSPSVVRVNVHNAKFEVIGVGSGFFIRDGATVVTNFHVIEGSEVVSVVLPDGTELWVMGAESYDHVSDIVVLRVFAEKMPLVRPLSVAKELPPIASKVFVIGAPAGLDNSFSEGAVSGHRQIGQRTWIQTTAPISPGSSGSPVFNEKGEVIGMATMSRVGGQNLNFALASRHIQEKVPVGVKSLLMELSDLPSRKPPQRQAADPVKPADPVRPKDDEDGLKEAQRHIAAGVNRRAMQVLDDIPADRRGPNYWRVRASAMFAVENYQESAKCYAESLKLDNTRSDMWIRYATAMRLHWLIDKDAILTACRAALSIDPNDARAYYLMGVTFPGREERIDALKTALSLDQNDLGTHYQLGCEFAVRRQVDARKHFKRALDLVVKEHARYQAVKPKVKDPSAGMTLKEILWDNRVELFTQQNSLETFLRLNLAAACEGEELISICRDVLKREPQNKLAAYMIEKATEPLGRPLPNSGRLLLVREPPPEAYGELSLSAGTTGILVFRK